MIDNRPSSLLWQSRWGKAGKRGAPRIDRPFWSFQQGQGLFSTQTIPRPGAQGVYDFMELLREAEKEGRLPGYFEAFK